MITKSLRALLLSAPLALIVGCSGEQVQDAANTTATGIEKAGDAADSGGMAAGEAIKDLGEKTGNATIEKAADATGAGIEKAGELTEKAADATAGAVKDLGAKAAEVIEKPKDQ